VDDGVDLNTGAELAERAKALATLIDENADDSDVNGELAEPVVAALHANGIFGMWVPETLGGSELDPVESLDVIANLSYADPSVGWVVMAASLAIGTGAAYLDDDAVKELFGDGQQTVIAGQGTRPGTASSKDGGFLLSGEWSFASGIKHSTHIHTLGIIEETGEPRIFVLPVEQATLIDNWDVLGLRGTGSIDYTIDSVFVPEPYTHFAFTEQPRRGGGIYGMGIIGFATICHSGWAMGVGRRMLDELAALARSKAGRAGAQADSDAFLQGYAKAEGAYRAARALVVESWNDARDTLLRGDTLSVRQNTLIRLALTHITATLHEVANFVYLAGGTTALRRGVIQRLLRDVHAGTQHITSAPAVTQACGKELAGLAPGQVWQLVSLVDPA
jgi:alkylation response protein AidB-like acyl-CoA dehydrogenase